MGRHVPEKQYDIVFCKNQGLQNEFITWSGNASFDNSSASMNENELLSAGAFTLPFVSGNRFVGQSGLFFVYPNAPTYVTDELACHQSFVARKTSELDNYTPTLRPLFIWDTYGKGTSTGTNFTTGTPCLPILTGLTRTVSAATFPLAKYIPLDSSGGVILTQGVTTGTPSDTSGYRVTLQRLTFASTGFITGSSYVIPDTVTNDTTAGTGTSSKFTFAEIASDLSYTGTVKRVLIGYLGITGSTSGTLAARLAEISGNLITYGDPVIIRSSLSSGAHRQSIYVTYHGSGSGANCFAIATAVDSGNLAVLHSVSGQIVACNPASGLTLSGSFGTPVTIFGSSTFISRVSCCALEYTTSSQLPVGYVVGISGVTASSGIGTGDPAIQMYRISGTTITTTGQLSFGGYNPIGTGARFSTYIPFSGSNAFIYPVRNTLVGNLTANTVSNSGVFACSMIAGTGTTAYSVQNTPSGSGAYVLLRAPSTFTGSSPVSIFTYIRGMDSSEGSRDIQNYSYVIPENPYSGQFFSAFSIISRSGLGTLGGPVLAINKFNVSGDIFPTGATGFRSGVCFLNTGTVYTNSPGTIRNTAQSNLGFYSQDDIHQNIIHVIGNFPNYSRIFVLGEDNFNSSFISQQNIITYNFGTSGQVLNSAAQVCKAVNSRLGDTVTWPLGLVLSNPSDPGNTGLVISGTTGYYYITGESQITGTSIFASTGIPVKLARTQKARTDIVKQMSPLTTIIFVKNKSVLDMS